MKKFYFKSIMALTALFGLGTTATADVLVGNGVVKMTYVDFNFPDSVFGQKDSILVGYNKVPAVGAAVGFGNTGWGCNWIGYVQVDVSSIPGVIQKAVLKAQVSGCTAPDASKSRNSAWGVALTDAAWSNGLTYNNTNATFLATKILNNGQTVGGTGAHKDNFSDIELDITDAVAGGDASKIVTLMVYETAAEGAYFTTPVVEVEYDPFEATTTIIDFEDEDVSKFPIYDVNRLTVAAEANEAQGSKVANFTCKSNGGIAFAAYDHSELTKQAAMVDYSFDFCLNECAGISAFTIADAAAHTAAAGGFTAKNNWGYGTKGTIFYVGNNRGKLNGSSNENYVSINGVAVAGSTLDIKAADIWGKWLHADVTVNVAAKTVSYTISNEDSVIYADNGVAWVSADALNCTQFDVYMANTGTHYLDNLKITNYKSNAVFADYAVKYVDADGNELKEARASNGQVGKPVTLIDADKASFYNEDNSKKYIYDTDNSDDLLIAESGTEVLIQFREAEVYNAVLNCYIEGTTGAANRLDQIMGTFFEGDNYYVRPSRGYGKDGKYYFTQADSYNGKVFTFPGSINPNKQGGKTYYIGTLYYSAVDSVAYYSEFERLALPTTDEGNGVGLGQLVGTVNSWYSFSGGYFDRFSGGRGIRLDAGSYVYTEPIAEAATYKVTIYGRNDVSAAAENPFILGILKEDGSQLDYVDLTIPTWGSATTGPTVVEGVAIPAGAKLVVKNDDAAKKISLDDISLTKTGDYVEPNLVSGIQEVQVAGANAAIYSISGQRLNAAPAKGLYIQNGKKFVVK